jgi:hypothetical protein
VVNKVIPPSPIAPFLSEDGSLSPEARAWTQITSDRAVIVGDGSPESAVIAGQGALYMNTSGTTGNILYIKRDNDINNEGWILV